MNSSPHSLISLFLVFLRLGCTSFGGPVAHLGYFREEFVRRRRWLTDEAFADLVALCQFLPGPASSQVNYAVGFLRRGWVGGIVAWSAFTLPSALVLILFAYGLSSLGNPDGSGWVLGLKLAAVAVVAKAVWGMGTQLCTDRATITLALFAGILMLLLPYGWMQISVIAGGAVIGWLFLQTEERKSVGSSLSVPLRRRTGLLCLGIFAVLLVGLWLATLMFSNQYLAVFEAFYRSGSLVFGGGHLVLPLLEETVVRPGWVDQSTFLAGYGATQAVPGPLFTFSAFLGTAMNDAPNGFLGGIFCLIAIYVPSVLLVTGLLPFWDRVRRNHAARRALRGTNAAVVGLLLAAFYDPVWTSAVISPEAVAFVLAGFLLLQFWKLPPWALVILSGFAGWAFL